MEREIRPIGMEELEAFVAAGASAFLSEPKSSHVDAERRIFEPDRSLAVFEAGQIVAGTMAATFELTVPGAIVPAAGVTSVAVVPTHRRQGLLTTLMRRQLDDLHARGELLAVLWASEAPIYRRFGYGVASYSCAFRIERVHAAFAPDAPPPSGRMRLVGREEATKRLPPVYEAVRRGRPGALGRNDQWWEYLLTDPEDEREGYSPFFFAVHEGNEVDDGYVVYRLKGHWQDGVASGRLLVHELVAATPEAAASVWRYVLGTDLVSVVKGYRRPPDDPVLAMLADPRRLRFTLRDGLHVRLVDVAGALAVRRYRAPGRLVIEVADPFCAWNAGRYALDGGPDAAECRPTDDDVELSLDVRALAAAYLGGVSFASLAGAGLVEERAAGALARADLMFASAVAPWCPHVF